MKVTINSSDENGRNLNGNDTGEFLVDVCKKGGYPEYKNVIARMCGSQVMIFNPATLDTLLATHHLNVWFTNIRPIKGITIEV